MLPLTLRRASSDPVSILCLGAHSDDIEIGCAGTILGLLARYSRAQIEWVVLSGGGERGEEARRSAEHILRGTRAEIRVEDFRDGFFPYQPEIKEFFESLKGRVKPDIIFTHHRDDLHQDHRTVSGLTWNTFRHHLILEYEVPKYDGELGSPNLFVPLSARIRQRKIRHLMRHFGSQRSKKWYDEQTFLGLMRLRGVECAAVTGYAEGFHCRKAVLGL